MRIICLLLLCSLGVHAQNAQKKTVEILHADLLQLQEKENEQFRKLIGNVRLKQEDMYMWCDSAILFKSTNNIDAYGNVHIQQDTIDVYGDALHFDSDERVATLRGNAQLSDSRIVLKSDVIYYHIDDHLAWYNDKALITQGPTRLSSKRGRYYADFNSLQFKDSVIIRDPNYNLKSDTLHFNTVTEVALFKGPTTIFNKNSQIYCENGWYDSQADLAAFGENTVIENFPQQLEADSVFYNRNSGNAIIPDSFRLVDREAKLILDGTLGYYVDSHQSILAPNRAVLRLYDESDTLHICADTFYAYNIENVDTQALAIDKRRVFRAWYDVRLFRTDMQGRCDSMFFSMRDSSFRMYDEPIIWSDSTQMTGDTMILYIANGVLDRIRIRENAFIASYAGPELYDQIVGRHIDGFFALNVLRRMHVMEQGQSLYFGQNDGAFLGLNHAQSEEMWMYFAQRKIDRINFVKAPQAKFTPIRQVTRDMIYLDGFQWQAERRPRTIQDIH